MAMLAELKCSVCQADDPPMPDEEIQACLEKVPKWQVIEDDNVKKLRRVFHFDDYIATLAFTNAVAQAADSRKFAGMSQDDIDATKAPLLDHLIELRQAGRDEPVVKTLGYFEQQDRRIAYSPVVYLKSALFYDALP